ncbi:MAG: hypothetical protein FIA95_12570 [Gemmatimonadetes bacterium]|nr:hypothetical protein [Gemmatimonadota bacterium]
MSHVDEGALHAYLDGALDALPASEAARIRQHLAACGECARRLDEERARREEASALLAGADPGVGVPAPLEELRGRAAARTRAGSGVRVRQLAWAASLVLAVGAGRMLRASRDPRISEALVPAPRSAVEESTASPGAAQPAAEPRAEAGAPPAAGGAGAPAPESGTGAGVFAPPREAQRVAGVAAFDEPVRAEVSDVVEEEVLRGKAAETAVATLRRTLAAGRAQMAAVLADSAASRLSPSPAAQRIAPSMAVTTEARAGAEAERSALTVPGLPVVFLGPGGPDLPAGTLRVIQLLDGDTLELLHLPAGADPSAITRAVDAGRTQVAVRYGAGWLVGSARVSAETREALLARVTGGG